jgi:hypothetical protein
LESQLEAENLKKENKISFSLGSDLVLMIQEEVKNYLKIKIQNEV